MNKPLLVGAVLGAAGITAGGALATYGLSDRGPQYAEVLAVQSVKESIKTPRQECREVAITRQRPVQDQHQLIGTAVGAIAGGLLGNQVGGGNGKKLATVAGAVGGGYAGNKGKKVEGGGEDRGTYRATETRCKTVNGVSEKIVGYDVKYELDGKVRQVRMDRDPGDRLPVRDGQVVLAESGEAGATSR